MSLAGASVLAYGASRVLRNADADLQPLVAAVQPGDFALRIPSAGELQAVDSVVVAVPPVPVDRLRIASVVATGTRVNKGDVLVEFDPAELDLQMQDHRSDLEVVNQNINKGGLSFDEDKTDLQTSEDIAELELKHISQFRPRNAEIYSRRDIIEGELNKEYAEKKIVFAQTKITMKGKAYSLDEAILLVQQQQAHAKINQVATALASLKLLSPASGIVVYNDPGFFFGDRSLMPGRVVWIGMALFNLVNPAKMEAKCFVLEKDAGELRTGEPVTVKLDPYPDSSFTGKVKGIEKVARSIDRDSPVKYFQTIVSLDQTDTNLMKPGVKLKAEINAGEMKSVLVVPRSAVVKNESGYAVYIQKAPNKFEAASVKLGAGDMIQVVVIEGLAPGQILALNPPDVRRDFLPGSTKKPRPDTSPKPAS
jgi:multidrug efflux pump subunit AcrA (membrane-fusion protein)